MAITTEYSVQTANAYAGKKGYVSDVGGGLLVIPFDFTQGAAAGDIGSFALLGRDGYPTLPAGRFHFVGPLCLFTCDTLGAARTLDFGWDAYTDEAGVAVAADDNGLDNDIDVSAALTATTLGKALVAGTGLRKIFSSRAGVVLRFTVAGGTIPAAAKINGHLVFIRN